MNKNKIVGIVLMAPLIILIIYFIGFFIYSIITDAPMIVWGTAIVLFFVYGLKLLKKE